MKLRLALLLDLCVLCFASQNLGLKPRIIQHNPVGRQPIPLPRDETNPVFYLDEQKFLYIGGREALYYLDFKTTNYSLTPVQYNCKINVTFLGHLNKKLMVCGTSGSIPVCCKRKGENEEVPKALTEQLSPRDPRANYNILITGNDVYSTIPRRSNNGRANTYIFRKIAGREPLLYTNSIFMRNPLFVKSLTVEKEDHVQNKIFLFFMEDNPQTRCTQKRVPMIAQMCKEENGSEKPDARNMFSTALKTRLICGNQKTGQYYPFLQDIYFLKTQKLIYGLFINAWNHSAVCTYKVMDIELVFSTSDLYGSSRRDLKTRPGTCLANNIRTPQETSDEAVSYPELTSWVWPMNNQTVFQTLYHYKKLLVDEMEAVDKKTYRVIILATDSGALHKVVEFDDGALNILELHPFTQAGEILHLELDPNKTEHVLYLGSVHEVSKLPLDDCSVYGNSIENCLSATDPYCGWSGEKCQSILTNKNSEMVQNLTKSTVWYRKESTTEFQKPRRATPSSEPNLPPLFQQANNSARTQYNWLVALPVLLYTVCYMNRVLLQL